MRIIRLLLLFVAMPAFVWAQADITGKIIRSDTKNPVAGANVFLNNSSYGTSSASDGTFILHNVSPGQYTLTIAHLGLAQFTLTVLVSKEPIKLSVEMTPKAIMLREVSITTRADWLKNFELFKKEFIGTDANAKYCEIVNPQVLDFTYYSTQKTLLASANQFIIIDNKALGYRVKFLLDTFKLDGINHILTMGGKRVFEDLPGKEIEKKKWHIARDSSYYGSQMHFFRALYQDHLLEEGFEMHRYIRYINPERPPEDILIRRLDLFNSLHRPDSAKKYYDWLQMSRYYHEKFYPEYTFPSEVARKTIRSGIFAFSFPDCMFISYKYRQETERYKDIYQPLSMPNYRASVLTFTGRDNVCFFDLNGIIVEGGVLIEGSWSKSRLSQLLPVDYQPNPENSPVRSLVFQKRTSP